MTPTEATSQNQTRQDQTMTRMTSRAFPAPSFTAADEPLRLPRRRRDDVRIDAARQLRLGVWLVLLITVALGATWAARPPITPADGARESAFAAPQALHAPVLRTARLAMAEAR